jgi:hypothetical protein
VQAADICTDEFVRELNTQSLLAKTDIENVGAIKEISSVLEDKREAEQVNRDRKLVPFVSLMPCFYLR